MSTRSPSPRDPNPLAQLIADHHIVVCTGSGGVGKTTTAAVMAMEAARQGRRACVVTIDPARRLANAMGLKGLTGSPTQVEGPWPGELWALMLDTKSTFDDLVTNYAADPSQSQSILDNRFYRNISEAMSGTQEYMAMEKLYELHNEGGFDVIVVDTPPTRNALDFLDAPRRLTQFLNSRVYRVVMMPTRGLARAVNVAAQAFLRTVSKVIGGQVVADSVEFFAAFEGMEQGFKDRADAVVRLLADDTTAFVLVTAPRRDVVDEASFFAEKLEEAGLPVRALIVNRVHPHFTPDRPDVLAERAASFEGTDLGELYANLAEFALVASTEDAHLHGLTAKVAPAPVTRVPFLGSDVHDLDGLDLIAEHLFRSGS